MEKYLYVYELVEVTPNVFEEIPFPDPNDNPLEITDFTYSASRHGVPMISATINSPQSLQGKWNHKQVVTFRNTKFYITEIPSLKHDNANPYYRYEVQMYPAWNVVTKTYFYDVVDGTATDSSEKYFSNSTNVTFFGTLKEFISRINASFKLSELDYQVKIDDSLIGSEIVNVVKEYSGDKMTLLDAMKKAFEVWEVPFYMDSDSNYFVFGYFKNDIGTILRYGYDKELISVEKNNAHANIITRATGVGSEQNIPFYYPNDTERGNVSYSLSEWTYTDNDGNSHYNDLTEGEKYEVFDKNAMANALKETSTFYYTNFQPNPIIITYKKMCVKRGDIWGYTDFKIDNNNRNQLKAGSISIEDEIYHSIRVAFNIVNEGKLRLHIGLNNSELAAKGYTFGKLSDFQNVKLYVIDTDVDDTNIGEYITGDLTYLEQLWMGNNASIDFTIEEKHNLYILEFYNLNVADKKRYYKNYPFNVKIQDYEFYLYLQDLSNGKNYRWVDESKTKLANFKKLREIGIAYDESNWDLKFTFNLLKKVPYQTNLMPSIFTRGTAFWDLVNVEEAGIERYYNAISNLYPTGSGSFYIFPNEYDKYGLKNQSEKVYEYDDIKPEIKGVVNADGQPIGEIADVAYDSDDNDYIKGTGSDANKYQHPYFYVKLHKTDYASKTFGFNLFDYALADEPMTLQITSGSLAGCKFKVQIVETSPNKFANPVLIDENGNLKTDKDGNITYEKCISSNTAYFIDSQQNTKKNEVWIALNKEDSTFGVVMPNVANNFKLKAGDTFNIININLPKAYILAAESRLDYAIIKDMFNDNAERFNFAIDFSRIYLRENYDENEVKNKLGIYSLLDESSRILVYVDDNTTVYQYVESYTYECKASEMLPKISLELANSIVKKESIAEKLSNSSNVNNTWQNLKQKYISEYQKVGDTIESYGIKDAYITDDGTIVLGKKSIKPVISTSDIMMSPAFPQTVDIWAELTKVDSTKIIDDSHISENIARKDDLKWREIN